MPTTTRNLPGAAPVARTATAPTDVTVTPSDTLGKIAQRAGVSVADLVAANAQRYPSLTTRPDAIQAGWRLAIPSRNGAPAAAATTTPGNTPPAAGWKPKSNNDVVVLGMNEGASHEAKHLKDRGNNVTLIKDGAKDDHITTGTGSNAVTHDLTNLEGARRFALTLGLPAEQTQKIADVIHGAGADARDEVAQLAQVWATAERGGQMPSRLVLSGHSVGSAVWGDKNGRLDFNTLGKLAEAMPRAARSVEDLHLSACYSGGQPLMERYRGIFPNAKTIWAYTGSAPGAHSGATTHLSRWDRATIGTKDELDRAIADGTRKGENVAVWSAKAGYADGKPPTPIETLRERVTQGRSTYDEHFSGRATQESPSTGPLRDHYNQVQRLLQHPDLPAAERPALEAQRDATIRLLYFGKTIAPRFQQTHAAAIDAGFRGAGLPVPNFANLTREQALTQIAELERRAATAGPAAQRLLPLLTRGLRELHSDTIPEGWI